MLKSSVECSVPLIGMVAEKLEVRMRGVGPGGLVWMALRGGYVSRLNVRDGWWGMALGGVWDFSGYSIRIASYGCKCRCVVGCRCEGGSAGAWACVGCDDFGCVR